MTYFHVMLLLGTHLHFHYKGNVVSYITVHLGKSFEWLDYNLPWWPFALVLNTVHLWSDHQTRILMCPCVNRVLVRCHQKCFCAPRYWFFSSVLSNRKSAVEFWWLRRVFNLKTHSEQLSIYFDLRGEVALNHESKTYFFYSVTRGRFAFLSFHTLNIVIKRELLTTIEMCLEVTAFVLFFHLVFWFFL